MRSNTVNLTVAGIRLAGVLLFVLSLSSCSWNSCMEVKRTLSSADEVMWTRPDSALALLESVDTLDLRTKALRARYSLLYTMALDRNYVDTTDIRIIMPAVRYYSRKGTPDDRLKALFYLGRMQTTAEKFDEAVVTLSRALEDSDKVLDKRMLGFVYSEIAYSYSQTKNFVESQRYYIQAEECFDQASEHRYSCMMVLNRARDCVGCMEWDVADSLFNRIIADDSFPSDYKAEAMASYGRMLTICPSSDYDKALSMFGRSIELSSGEPFYDVNDECVYAYALAKVGRKKESKEIFDRLDKRGAGELPVYRYCLSQIKKMEGDYAEAYSMLLESLKDTDERILKTQSQSFAVAQRNYYQLSNLEKDHEMLLHRLWMAVLVLSSTLVVACVSALLYRRYSKADKERRKLALLVEAADRNLAESKESAELRLKDLEILQADYLKLYKGQCQWMFPFAEILYGSKEKKPKQSLLKSGVLDNIIQTLGGINSENQQGQVAFESELNRVYDNAMRKFRTDFKDWNETDIRLFSCIVAQFDAVLILRIFDLPSKDAVYMRRSRLKEKIRQSDSKNKNCYLMFF